MAWFRSFIDFYSKLATKKIYMDVLYNLYVSHMHDRYS